MSSLKVCVAVEHNYDESTGSYSVFHMWDGKKLSTEGGMYSGLAYNEYSVNASKEQILAASEYARDNAEECLSYDKRANGGLGADTYVGCIVKLARSRKAPNKVDLKVIDYTDRYFSNKFNNWVDAKITVQDDIGNTYSVSVGCIDEVVRGVKMVPFWAI